MEEQNQRGIFDDLPQRNMYEGEDLDVPAYLRRGVKLQSELTTYFITKIYKLF